MNDRITRVLAGTVAAVGAMVAAIALAPAVMAQTTPLPSAKASSKSTPPATKTTTPVNRPRSCSQYGEGFVNVPGTDSCIKVDGYVRTDAVTNR